MNLPNFLMQVEQVQEFLLANLTEKHGLRAELEHMIYLLITNGEFLR